MKFIRKNGRIIPIKDKGAGSAPKKKTSLPKKSSLKHEQAKTYGFKVGAISSLLLTPLIGIPIGYAAYKSRDSKKNKTGV